MKEKVQSFGRFLSGMVMPNIGAFIAWGLMAALYTKEQYYPSKKVWDENRIISLINKRNDSIVAHGMRPVLKENTENSFSYWR